MINNPYRLFNYGIWHRGEGRYVLWDDDKAKLEETCRLWNSLHTFELFEVQLIDYNTFDHPG